MSVCVSSDALSLLGPANGPYLDTPADLAGNYALFLRTKRFGVCAGRGLAIYVVCRRSYCELCTSHSIFL